MRVRFSDGETQEVAFLEGTVGDLLSDLGINPVVVIVSRSGVVITEDTPITCDDDLLITRIVHGG